MTEMMRTCTPDNPWTPDEGYPVNHPDATFIQERSGPDYWAFHCPHCDHEFGGKSQRALWSDHATEATIETNIPCPDSNTIAGDCPGHLIGRRQGTAWTFSCNECGRHGGEGR